MSKPTITIQGEPGSGKTGLAYFIASALLQLGIESEITDSHTDPEGAMQATAKARIAKLRHQKIRVMVFPSRKTYFDFPRSAPPEGPGRYLLFCKTPVGSPDPEKPGVWRQWEIADWNGTHWSRDGGPPLIDDCIWQPLPPAAINIHRGSE